MQLATFSPSETIKPASSNAVKKEAQKKTKTFLVMLLIHCCGDHKTPSFTTVTAGKGKQKIALAHRKIMPLCVFKFNYGCQESVDGAVDGSPTPATPIPRSSDSTTLLASQWALWVCLWPDFGSPQSSRGKRNSTTAYRHLPGSIVLAPGQNPCLSARRGPESLRNSETRRGVSSELRQQRGPGQ